MKRSKKRTSRPSGKTFTFLIFDEAGGAVPDDVWKAAYAEIEPYFLSRGYASPVVTATSSKRAAAVLALADANELSPSITLVPRKRRTQRGSGKRRSGRKR